MNYRRECALQATLTQSSVSFTLPQGLPMTKAFSLLYPSDSKASKGLETDPVPAHRCSFNVAGHRSS